MANTMNGKKQHTQIETVIKMETAQHVRAPFESRYRELYCVVAWTGCLEFVPRGPVTTETPGVTADDGGRGGPVATAKEEDGRAGPVATAIEPDVALLIPPDP